MALKYLEQDCEQPLSEALDDYFAEIPGLLNEENADDRVAALFRRHDIGHVVFGCDTTLNGEPLADTFCMFGTDVTLAEYAEYARIPETKQVFKDAGIGPLLWSSLKSIPAVLRALWICWRMPKKFPFWDNDVWLDVPLREIRREFGIRVVRH